MNAIRKVVLTASVCTLAAWSAQASIVSWNYNSNGNAYGTQNTDVSGVEAAAYWNDSVLDGLTTDLLDSTGAASTIDIVSLNHPGWGGWSITGNHPGTDTDGSYNREILNGYLNGTTGAGGSGITLGGLDGYGGTYDVIVYFSSDTAGRAGSVTDGTTTYYFSTLGAASVNDASGNAVFGQTSITTEGDYSATANYAIFSGLSGDSQTFTVNVDNGGGLVGVQVIPEPSSMGLIALSSAGILFIRRRCLKI